MRVLWLWLGLTTAVALAAPGTALGVGAPAPDPAPPPVAAPQPDPDPVAADAPAPPPATPPQQEVTPPAPSTAPASPQPSAPPPAEVARAPRAEPPRAPRRERPQREVGERSAERQIASVDLAHALPAHLGEPLRAESGDGTLSRAAIALLLVVVAAAASLRLTLRLAGPLALLLVLATAPSAGAQEWISSRCDTASSSDGCNRWYTSAPVSLQWSWSPFAVGVIGCDNGSFVAEGRVQRGCTVNWPGTSVTRSVWIGIDRTPPTVAAAAERAADYGGWFNHPVTISFQGTDAASGVASCDSVRYGGPDGAGVTVSGVCRDVAGHVASAGFVLNYDATPPAEPEVDITPGDRLVDLDWSLAGGAVSVEVARVEPGPDEVVYRGAKSGVVDRGLRNGVRQRYRVAAIDQAGNRSADVATAVPTSSPLLIPARGAHLRSPPPLEWKRKKGASYYNVQLFRGRRKVLSRWPQATHVQLKRTWRFAGKPRRLVPGRYTWFVWPGFGERAKRDYGRLMGKSSFRIVG
jgi:hypothetical protein